MSDKEIYQLIADELETKNIDAALWAQAKESALGDPDKTAATYIRLRFIELVKSSHPLQKSTSLVSSTNTSVTVKPKTEELSQMRTELAKKLLSLGRHSLYSTLSLHPDASDAVIATAISDLESRELVNSGISPAEFKYAKDTLSDSNLREQYDRQLLESVSNKITRTDRFNAFKGEDNTYSWWESSKTSIIIGLLSLFTIGYLGINYLNVRNTSEVQKIAVESQKEALQTISNAAQMKIKADVNLRSEESRMVAERQAQEMELRNTSVDRMRDEQRAMQENRMQAELQQRQAQVDQAEKWQRAQQEQAENLRAAREKQYWTCMNMQLSQPDSTSYDANARCSLYRGSW